MHYQNNFVRMSGKAHFVVSCAFDMLSVLNTDKVWSVGRDGSQLDPADENLSYLTHQLSVRQERANFRHSWKTSLLRGRSSGKVVLPGIKLFAFLLVIALPTLVGKRVPTLPRIKCTLEFRRRLANLDRESCYCCNF
jgi:hypothetical protein